MVEKIRLLKKLARLAVRVGANVQKNQIVLICAPSSALEFVRLIQKEAYLAGARKVYFDFTDNELIHNYFDFANLDTINEVPNWEIERYKYFVLEKACKINVISPDLTRFEGLALDHLLHQTKINNQTFAFVDDFYSSSKSQWTLIAYPNKLWCKLVFPDLKVKEAYEKLLDVIIKTSRITPNNDIIEEWQNHIKTLENRAKILTDYNFEKLTFKNSLGTSLEVGLVANHVWIGGGEFTENGVYFVPNIPTEEIYTMPHKYKVNGKVVGTKPFIYQGRLIKDFCFIFEDGRITKFASKNKEDLEVLDHIFDTDESLCYLGEIALVPNDSPISNLNILFFNTLFDENASCHLALGNAFSSNVKNGIKMTPEELEQIGANYSSNHIDLMFGSSDMEINGYTKDGKIINIFKKGNFVL